MENQTPFGLPQEFIDFVNSGQKLDYTPSLDGYVLESENHLDFVPIESLEKSVFEFRPLANEMLADMDPREGYYPIEGICLIKYGMALVWFTELKCFGQVDEEHAMFFTYKDIPWQEIVDHQSKYLTAIWGDGDYEVYEYVFMPSAEQYSFIED